MKKRLIILSILSAIALIACTKEGPQGPAGISGTTSTANPELYHTWEIITQKNMENGIKYLVIKPDNSIYSLNQDSLYGFKSIYGQTSIITANQFIAFILEKGGGIYNYSISHDTLKLTSTLGEVLAKRNDNAPNETAWIKQLVSQDSMQAPIPEGTDMAYDGQYLIYGNAYDSHALYRLNTNTHSIHDTITTQNSAWAVAWDGSNIWTSNNGFDKIIKIDAAGNNMKESASMGSWIKGIAWDGQSMWCWSDNETIYEYNPLTDQVTKTFANIGRAGGMEYVNGYLYMCSEDGSLQKCTTNPLKAVETYRLPTGYIEGVAYDGADFWLSVRKNNGSGTYEIHKVSL